MERIARSEIILEDLTDKFAELDASVSTPATNQPKNQHDTHQDEVKIEKYKKQQACFKNYGMGQSTKTLLDNLFAEAIRSETPMKATEMIDRINIKAESYNEPKTTPEAIYDYYFKYLFQVHPETDLEGVITTSAGLAKQKEAQQKQQQRKEKANDFFADMTRAF